MYSQHSLAEKRFVYPRSQREGSYKIQFVCPSFHLPISFLEIGSLVFSETWHNVRSPHIVVCDRAGFFRKNPPQVKMVKNGPKTWFFRLFKKIMSLVLSGICVKSKFLWFINILRKLHAWEKSSSKVKAKMALSQ